VGEDQGSIMFRFGQSELSRTSLRLLNQGISVERRVNEEGRRIRSRRQDGRVVVRLFPSGVQEGRLAS